MKVHLILNTLPEQTNLNSSLAKCQYYQSHLKTKSDLVSNGQLYIYIFPHLLLYVILVMVSLFNIRFRNEFEVSDIWNGTDKEGWNSENRWERQSDKQQREKKKEKRGVGRGKEGKKKQIISDNFRNNCHVVCHLEINKATNISGEVNLQVIQFRM